jgi:hypothetical protein
MSLTLDQLRDATYKAITGTSFALPIDSLGSKTASAVADQALHAGTVRLTIGDPTKAVSDAPPAGLLVTGTGVDPPFTGLPATLHVFILDGEAEFVLTATAIPDWQLPTGPSSSPR